MKVYIETEIGVQSLFQQCNIVVQVVSVCVLHDDITLSNSDITINGSEASRQSDAETNYLTELKGINNDHVAGMDL